MSDYPRPYKPGPIEPVVEAGQNLLLQDRLGYYLYRVAYVEPLPRSHAIMFNGGALTAGQVLGNLNTQTQLDMQYGQLAQLRMRVLDDIDVVVYQPSATARGSNKNQIADFNAYDALYDNFDHLSEVFIFEDQRIFFQFTNPTQYPLTQSRVSVYGIKYVLYGGQGASTGGHVLPNRTFDNIQDAVNSGERFTVVPIGGWGQ
jgi:hypothetical protein